MSDKNTGGSERRGGTSDVISNMLEERNRLLALLLQASDMNTEKNQGVDTDLLDEFCQIMVDYIALGHFGLYERIVEGTERRKGVAELAVQLYPTIEASTEIALAFNEKYDTDKEDIDYSRIHEDLSVLGENLTSRIEHEDQLIQKLSEGK